MTQKALIFEYYKAHLNKEIAHKDVVDWSTSEYQKRTGNILRDPDRAIRSLHQEGKLIKIRNGVYKYDPDQQRQRELQNFTAIQKKQILERDNFRCVICGKGKADGVEIHIDHIKPKDKGGKAEMENGQVLCGQHNYKKKFYNQTETGKKLFINLYNLADKENDEPLKRFCRDILQVYSEHDVNGHIEWKE